MTTKTTCDVTHDEAIRPTHHYLSFSPSIVRLAPLLANRNYHSRELALELRITEQGALRVREWCRHGLPNTHDEAGRILINGQSFASWVREHTRSRNRKKLLTGHMWCPGCNQPQPFDEVTASIDTTGHRPYRSALCPLGHRMSQWVSVRRK